MVAASVGSWLTSVSRRQISCQKEEEMQEEEKEKVVVEGMESLNAQGDLVKRRFQRSRV